MCFGRDVFSNLHVTSQHLLILLSHVSIERSRFSKGDISYWSFHRIFLTFFNYLKKNYVISIWYADFYFGVSTGIKFFRQASDQFFSAGVWSNFFDRRLIFLINRLFISSITGLKTKFWTKHFYTEKLHQLHGFQYLLCYFRKGRMGNEFNWKFPKTFLAKKYQNVNCFL